MGDPLPLLPLPAKALKAPRQLRMVPLDEVTAREIVAEIWGVVQPRLSGRMTRTAWSARNKRAALEMAQAGLSTAEVLKAHEAMCTERGDVIYTLAYVHEFIARGPRNPVSRPVGRIGAAGSPYSRPGDYAQRLEDGTVIIGNLNDPPPLSELVARQDDDA